MFTQDSRYLLTKAVVVGFVQSAGTLAVVPVGLPEAAEERVKAALVQFVEEATRLASEAGLVETLQRLSLIHI